MISDILAMAAVADMGEVDEMHSNEEGGIVTNGDLSNDTDMENQDSQDSLKKASLSEMMDVDEGELENSIEAKDTFADSTEGTSDSSSAASDNSSDINEDESSQETKTSEDQTESREEQHEQDEVEQDGDDEEELEKSDDDELVIEKIENEGERESVQKSTIVEETSCHADGAEESDSEKKRVNTDYIKEQFVELKEADDEIHEIDSDDDEEENSKSNLLSNNDEPIELNDSGGEGDGDVMIVEMPKENGTDPTEIIDLEATPEKKPIKKKENVTPRRSTRNLNKSKSYVETDKDEVVSTSATPVPPAPASLSSKSLDSEESDVEEVLPQDPLACSDPVVVEKVPVDKPKVPRKSSSTIVVKDTKKLVEIAAKSNSSTQGKKEPTLVIIDTNSILSGRGPMPVPAPVSAPVSAPVPVTVNNKSPAVTTSSYQAMLPMALPAQGMYPPNMRATITPIPMNTTNIASTPPPKISPATITPSLMTPLLPTLTDDMFVVEAPSFIVPYVYEKPPVNDFKDFIKDMEANRDKLEDLNLKKDGDEKEDKKGSKEGEGSSKGEKETVEKMEVDAKVESAKKEEPADTAEASKNAEAPKLDDSKKSYSYFDSPLGKFFINIGFNLVQEFVQSDLLKQQKRKHNREGGCNPETEKTIKSLVKNLEFSKENNEPFKIPIKKCEFCNFKTESALAMSYHLETPHMKNFIYKCNFCPYEVRSPHDILFHMEAEHAVRGHLERAPAFHQCPNCPFEDNQKGKLSRHLVACMRKFKPERNLEAPVDWEPPAKIPRVPKMRQQGLNATAAAYQAMSKNSQYQFLSKMQLQSTQQVMQRGRGRPQLGGSGGVRPVGMLKPSGMVFKQQAMSGGSVLVPTNYQLSGNQVYQTPAKKPTQQPSISITPLPRGSTTTSSPVAPAKPGDTTSKNSFVICEICDGYIKDLEQLRNHMQWIHKIKIHPKMIYNRPPLNCQKCQFRFFTDQGLERHLLGSHGLVTSSMQDAANKSKDSGRCPVCGRVYQWKLLNHVARDHNMTLKPAHLSYKCTVCTATFGMYKQFENHVYSAHSVVAKRVMDKKPPSASPSANKTSDQMKPLKINDEITIIPQPAKSTNGASKEGSPSSTGSSNSKNSTPSTSKSR